MLGKKQQLGMNQHYPKLNSMLGIDKRALALFRFSLGLIGVYDMIERWPDIKAHYSDEGLLPRSVVVDHYWNQSWFSVHLMAGSVGYVKLIFLANIFVCFCLMVGWKSKLMSILNWLFIISIQARNNVVGHGGDVYMRLISYFGMFLPMGAVFSIDSAFKHSQLRRESKKFNVLNLATLAMLIQISFLYVFSYAHKTGDEWKVDYTATFFALQLDYFRTFIADFLLLFPTILQVLTFCVLYYEGFGMLCCVFPIYTNQIKTFGAMGFTMLHIGFAACMRLGIFSPICATGTILLYPTWFWDQIYNYLRTKREWVDFKIYYQSKMGYYIAGLVSTFLLLPDIEVGPLTANSMDEELIPNSNNLLLKEDLISGNHSYKVNWIVTKDHKSIKYTGYKAMISIFKASPLLWPLVKIFEINIIGVYSKKMMGLMEKAINKWEDFNGSRYLTSQLHQPSPNTNSIGNNEVYPDEAHFHKVQPKRERLIKFSKKLFVNGFAILSIFLALSWNCTSVNCGVPIAVPEAMSDLILTIRMDQMWSMFSPRPPAVHWWYTFEGELDDGTPVELWNNRGLYTWEGNIGAYSRDKPDPYPPCIGNHRWFKVYENLNTGSGYEIIRLGMGRWVCRQWNQRHQDDTRLHKFNIVYRNEKQNLDNTRTQLNDVILWSHICYDKTAVDVPDIQN